MDLRVLLRHPECLRYFMATVDAELYALIKLLIQHGAQINGTWVEWRDHACGNAVYGNLGRLTCWQWDGTSSSCYLPSIYCPSDRPIDHVDSGLTPLMHAAQFQTDLQKVKPLLSFGADPTLKDARGCTALDLAPLRFGRCCKTLCGLKSVTQRLFPLLLVSCRPQQNLRPFHQLRLSDPRHLRSTSSVSKVRGHRGGEARPARRLCLGKRRVLQSTSKTLQACCRKCCRQILTHCFPNRALDKYVFRM